MNFEGTTTLARSAIMRGVKGKDTSPELLLRKVLWRAGLRYRIHFPMHSTCPDLVFLRQRVVAIFVDGCFWHGCPQHYKPPQKNVSYWAKKIERNSVRDARDTLRLQAAGWSLLRVWECEVRKDVDAVLDEIRKLMVGKRE